ncbi:MAG: NAD(P)/FAD-dependent oxidoreductase [Deltaproteobacteria bacterium]|nr:NAD(P)/FAD-dependent oxidoreductase [Deltaproteobacteria bacterium]
MGSSSLPHHTDIVVIGGGPAGTTIASLLARFGYKVILLEKRRFPRHQIGESLTPQILPVLDFLGLRQRVEAAGFLRMIGHTVCWGSSQPRTSYYSPDHSRYGFQAWRADLDAILFAHAQEAGVLTRDNLAAESVSVNPGRQVIVRTPEGAITADFCIDASGHAGVLARHGLRQRDQTYRTLAVTGYWREATSPAGVNFANTLLETYQAGLVWSVPLHNELRNVTLLTDWYAGATIRRCGIADFYRSELQRAPYISGFLASARLPHPPQVFDASWYTAKEFAGEQFLLVGDAGIFIDPLSSEGVHKAMASAITGAIVVNTILHRPAMTSHAMQFYNETQQATYESHYQQSGQYYREEQRWSDNQFWQIRTTQVQGSKFKVQELSQPHTQYPTPGSQKVSALRIAQGVTIALRPVIEGPYVELREVLVAPQYPRGVRTLQQVHLPKLLTIVRQQSAVSQIMTHYLSTPEGQGCSPEAVRQILARLYQEGILDSIDATETG